MCMQKCDVRILVVMLLFCVQSWSAYATGPLRHESINSRQIDERVGSIPPSPFASLRNVPIRAVTLGDGMWLSRFRTNADTSIPAFFRHLEKAGALDKLRGRKNKARGNSDADLAKWIEAASYVLQSEENKQIHSLLNEVVADISASAGSSGYLHTRYMKRMPADLENLKSGGHLYCLGHLLQAAMAYYQATRNEQLLDLFVRYVDNVINQFGPGKQLCWSGHPEIELALVGLYRTTGRKKYLDFARYLLQDVDLTKEENASGIDLDHFFAGVPFTSHKELSGHAVCALYVCCGATDYYVETGDSATLQTLLTLWSDLTGRKMYVTGGVGSRPSDEAIGNPYELPNRRGYAETCAAIGNVMWNWRLLNATGQARFADIMELTLYNGFLSGVSLDGRNYFYWNPLSSKPESTKEGYANGGQNLIAQKKATGIGLDVRQPYFRTPCCIGNAQRMIASLPGYIYSTSAKGVWIHLYHSSRLNWHLEGGQELILIQSTSYPWENVVEIVFERAPADEFSLFLRIPSWTTSARIIVNGELSRIVRNAGTYCEMPRVWRAKDRVRIEFGMPIRAVHANPRMRENRSCAALQRGPIIYCLESTDHPDISVSDILLPSDLANVGEQLAAEFESDILGGVVTIQGSVSAYGSSEIDQRLYSFAPFARNLRPVTMKAVPYFTWANRGPSEMTVWIPCVRNN